MRLGSGYNLPQSDTEWNLISPTSPNPTLHGCHGSGTRDCSTVGGVWLRTIRLAPLQALFASETHVSRKANRNALAYSSPSPHALGTFPGAHQRTAQPSGESGHSGARARPRRPRANLIGECSNLFPLPGFLSSSHVQPPQPVARARSSRLIMNTISAAACPSEFWPPYTALRRGSST